MALWDTELHAPTIAGVEVPIGTREVRGGQAFARHLYPFRDGQDTENTGRAPRIYELEIPLYRGVDESHYPDLHRELLDIFDDPQQRGSVEYVDPEHGPLQVQIAEWTWRTDPMERDGGRFVLRLEERLPIPVTSGLGLGGDVRARASSLAEGLDTALTDTGLTGDLADDWEDAGVPLTGDELDFLLEPDTLFVNLVDNFFAVIEDGALALDELAARIDTFRERLDRVMNFDPGDELARWSIVHSASALAATITTAGEEELAEGPSLVTYVTPMTMSMYEISLTLYGTAARAEEISALNPVMNPLFYPRGSTLVVFAS